MFSAIERLNNPASWNTTAIELRSEASVTSRMSVPSTDDAPVLGIAQPLEQGERRRLAGTGMPDQRHRLAGQRLEVEVIATDRAVGKAEGQVLVAHVAARPFERAGAGPVEHRARRVDQFEIGVDRRLLLEEPEEEMGKLRRAW